MTVNLIFTSQLLRLIINLPFPVNTDSPLQCKYTIISLKSTQRSETDKRVISLFPLILQLQGTGVRYHNAGSLKLWTTAIFNSRHNSGNTIIMNDKFEG
jgi:hypothetical protein